MLPIKLSDPMKPYSATVLKSGLRLVVSNSQPANRHENAVSASQALSNPLLGSFADGERTRALTMLAGQLLAKGVSADDVTQISQDWNVRQNPPLNAEKVRSTVESLVKTDARNHPERHGLLTPLFNIADADISMLLRTSPPPRRWLLQDMLPMGVVGMIVAPGGTGKSQLVLQLGVSVATGIPLCDLWQVGQQGKALLLLAEDEMDEVHRRLDRIVTELSARYPTMASALKSGLLIKSMTTENNLMTRTKKRGELEATNYVERLLMAVSSIPDLKLIVVDPASRFRGGDENSADDVTRFVEQLERLRQATGATVLVCHHANKASMNPKAQIHRQTVTRGSSAMTDGVRWMLELRALFKGDLKGLDPTKCYLEANVAKNNYGPPIDTETLIRKPNGYLTSIRVGGVAVTLEDRLLQLIRDEQQAGRVYSANSVEKMFGGETGQLSAGKVRVREAIKRLIDTGRLRKQRGKLAALSAKPPNAEPYTLNGSGD